MNEQCCTLGTLYAHMEGVSYSSRWMGFMPAMFPFLEIPQLGYSIASIGEPGGTETRKIRLISRELLGVFSGENEASTASPPREHSLLSLFHGMAYRRRAEISAIGARTGIPIRVPIASILII